MASLKDNNWIKRSFLVSVGAVTEQDQIRRELTEAEFKFTDTTLGGNFAINPPPQFCRNADIKVESRFSPSSGMGRYYSEALDDRGEFINMRFGVPQYNSLTNFFANFYDTNSGSMANKGRSPGAFYYLGRAIGFVVSLPLVPIIWTGQIINFLSSKPTSKYYYLKPTMPLYWSAVSTMVNMIGVNMGVIGKDMTVGEQSLRRNDPYNGKAEHAAIFKTMSTSYPNIFREDGGVDIYKVATRAQRMARKNRNEMQKALESSNTWEGMRTQLKNAMESKVTAEEPSLGSMDEYLKAFHSGSSTKMNDKSKEGGEITGDSFDTIDNDGGFKDYLIAELEDGTQFVTFRVDSTGSVSESFSNSVGSSGIAEKINSTSSSSRSARFDMADMNIGSGIVAGTLTSIMDSIKDVAGGVLDGLEMQGLASLAGSAFVDIPKVWQDSSADFAKSNYTIELRSPYGNPMSRFQNLIVPLSMLLAAGLPLSTGKQSYTSPFLVELFSKGRTQVRLGMVDSISITRGVGNLGWNRQDEPLGIDVSFSVIDLSSILHMPISSNFDTVDGVIMKTGSIVGSVGDAIAGGGNAGQQAGESVASLLSMSNFDDDNSFTNYMSVLGSLSLSDQIYPMNKLRLRRAQRAADFQQWKSPAAHANWLSNTGLGQMASALMVNTIVRVD